MDEVPPERRAALMVVLPALFAAITFVLGSIQVVKLNIEPKTVTIFVSGLVGGPLCGVLTGIAATALHQMLNTMGGTDLLFCSAQALAWGLTGWAGGRLAARRPGPVAAALAGATLTLLYHVLTDAAGGFATGLGFVKFFLGGFVPFPFTPLHVATNAVLFAFAVPALLPVIDRFRAIAVQRAYGKS